MAPGLRREHPTLEVAWSELAATVSADVGKGVEAELLHTPCPYARSASYVACHVAGGRDVPRARDLLTAFAQDVSLHRTHAFLVAVAPHLCPDVASFALTIRSLLSPPLCELRGPGAGAEQQPIRLCGADFFVLALAPWYSHEHSRRSQSLTLLLFQPEELFTSFGIASGPQRYQVTARVRRHFEQAGRSFPDFHGRSVPKPLRLLVAPDGKGVPWWEPSPYELTTKDVNFRETRAAPSPQRRMEVDGRVPGAR